MRLGGQAGCAYLVVVAELQRVPLPITYAPRQVGAHHRAGLSCGDRDDSMLRKDGQPSDAPAPPAGIKPPVLPMPSHRDGERLQRDKLSVPALLAAALQQEWGGGNHSPGTGSQHPRMAPLSRLVAKVPWHHVDSLSPATRCWALP